MTTLSMPGAQRSLRERDIEVRHSAVAKYNGASSPRKVDNASELTPVF